MSTSFTAVLLIRHADTDAIGRRLVGRMSGVRITEAGREQAGLLAARLAGVRLAAVYAGPLERAVDTADAIARHQNLSTRILEDLDEVDFGAWTGLTFTELERRPDWRAYNRKRSTASAPGGEGSTAVQKRVKRALQRLRQSHPGETVAAVTHADIIRIAVLDALGASLDAIHRLEIDPASITLLHVYPDTQMIRMVNGTSL